MTQHDERTRRLIDEANRLRYSRRQILRSGAALGLSSAAITTVLGATGLVTFAAQYQVEFFWVGLAFNAAGIAYIGNKLWTATKYHAQCAHT